MQLSLNHLALPARIRPERPMTDEELFAFCAENDFYRIEREPNGELSVMTPSGGFTSNKNVYISRVLDEWAERFGGMAFDSAGGFLLPDGSMRSPDAAWMPYEAVAGISDEQMAKFVPAAPYFILELRSPSDSLSKLQAKMEMWIANGVQLGWLVDPFRKVVTIYRPDRKPEEQEGHTSAFGEGLMASFELPLARVWA